MRKEEARGAEAALEQAVADALIAAETGRRVAPSSKHASIDGYIQLTSGGKGSRSHFIVEDGQLSLLEEELTAKENPALRSIRDSEYSPPPVVFSGKQDKTRVFKLEQDAAQQAVCRAAGLEKSHQGEPGATAGPEQEVTPAEFHKMLALRVSTAEEDDTQRRELASTLYVKTSQMCGASPFSQPALQCDRIDASAVDAYRFVDADVPQRAFGVELELVGRKPSSEQVERFAKLGSYYRHQVDDSMNDGAAMPRSMDLFPHYTQNSERDQDAIARAREMMAASPSRHDWDAVRGGMSPGATRPENTRKWEGLLGLSACFDQAKWGTSGAACKKHTDCDLSHYCSVKGQCEARNECGSGANAPGDDGVCPQLLGSWQWETDCTVRPFTHAQAAEVYPDDVFRSARETTGVPFELVSAAPPHALAGARGVKSVAEVFTVLKHMGVQGGPSQGMHVHVNVGKPGAEALPGDVDGPAGRGADLSPAQIANVWANYAKFQLVIEEMLQDSRMGNHWAKSLRFSRLTIMTDTGSYRLDDAAHHWDRLDDAARRAIAVLRKLHEWVTDERTGDGRTGWERDQTFCEFVLGRGVCSSRYPSERYQHINLAVLNKYGTIEFRAFPATNDPERAMQWIQFVLRFVEKMKDDDSWVKKDFETTKSDLASAQLEASFASLATAIAGDSEEQRTKFLGYWPRKLWMDGQDKICGTACVGDCKESIDEQEKEDAAQEQERLATEPITVIKSQGMPDSLPSPERSASGSRPALVLSDNEIADAGSGNVVRSSRVVSPSGI